MSYASDSDEDGECPLCMEEIDITDRHFKPCPCGYRICRFCWHHIKENLNGLCPACRRQYSENQIEFRPMSAEEVAKLKADKKAREREKKEQEAVAKKHMANIRVVQKNLAYILGLSPRLASEEILRQHDFFGQFGPIKKIVISRRGGGSTIGPTSSNQNLGVYITFNRKEDAAKAIEAVDGSVYEGRMLRATFGTTRYCQQFLRNVPCPNPQCMFLHEIGESAENGDIGEATLNHVYRGAAKSAPFPVVSAEKKTEKAALPASATWAKPQAPSPVGGKTTPTSDDSSYPQLQPPTPQLSAAPPTKDHQKERERKKAAKAAEQAKAAATAASAALEIETTPAPSEVSRTQPKEVEPSDTRVEEEEKPLEPVEERAPHPVVEAPPPALDITQTLLSSLTNFGLGNGPFISALNDFHPRYSGSFNPFEENDPLVNLRGPVAGTLNAAPGFAQPNQGLQTAYTTPGLFSPAPAPALGGVLNGRPPGFPPVASPARDDFDPFREESPAPRLPPPPGVGPPVEAAAGQRKASGGSRFERFFSSDPAPGPQVPQVRPPPALDLGQDRRFDFPINGTLLEQQAYANRVAMAQQRYFQMVGHQPQATPSAGAPPGMTRPPVSQFENATTADDFLNQFLMNARLNTAARPPGMGGPIGAGPLAGAGVSTMPFRDPAIMAMSVGNNQQQLGGAPRTIRPGKVPPTTLPPPGIGDAAAASGGRSRLRIFDDLVRPPNQPFLKAPTNGTVSSSGLSAVPIKHTPSESLSGPSSEQVFRQNRPSPAPPPFPNPPQDSWGSPPKTPMKRLDSRSTEPERWDASSVDESRESDSKSRRDTLSTTPGSIGNFSPLMRGRQAESPTSDLLADSDAEDVADAVHVSRNAPTMKPHEPINIPQRGEQGGVSAASKPPPPPPPVIAIRPATKTEPSRPSGKPASGSIAPAPKTAAVVSSAVQSAPPTKGAVSQAAPAEATKQPVPSGPSTPKASTLKSSNPIPSKSTAPSKEEAMSKSASDAIRSARPATPEPVKLSSKSSTPKAIASKAATFKAAAPKPAAPSPKIDQVALPTVPTVAKEAVAPALPATAPVADIKPAAPATSGVSSKAKPQPPATVTAAAKKGKQKPEATVADGIDSAAKPSGATTGNQSVPTVVTPTSKPTPAAPKISSAASTTPQKGGPASNASQTRPSPTKLPAASTLMGSVDSSQQNTQSFAASLNALAANLNLGSINLSGLGAGAQGATSAGNLNLAALGIDANAFIDQALESLAATAAMLAPALEAQARGAGGTGDLGLATSQLGNRWTQEEWKSKVRSVEAVMSRVKEARDLRKKQQDQQSKGKGPATPSRVSAPSAPSTPVGSTSSITTPASAAKALQSLLLDPKGTELATLSKEDLNLLSPLILSALKSKDGTATIPLTFDIDLGPSGQGAGDVKQLLSSVESIVGDFMQGVGHILKGAGMELVEDKDKRDIRIVSAANSGPASVTSKAQAAQPRNVEADLAVLQRQLSDGMAGVEKSLQEFNGLLAGFGGEAGIIGGSKVGTSTPASMSRATDSLALNSADVERHGLGKRAAPGAQNKVIADLELQLNEARAETMALELQLRKLADSNSKIVSLVFQAPNEPKPEILLSGLAGTAPSGGK